MLDEQSGSQLVGLGELSKESLDQLYHHVATENVVDENNQRNAVAQHIAEGIATNPVVADVAQRVADYAALPSAQGVPVNTGPQKVLLHIPDNELPSQLPTGPVTPQPSATAVNGIPYAIAMANGQNPNQVPVDTTTQAPPAAIPPGSGRQTAIAQDAVANASANVQNGATASEALDRLNMGINMQKSAIIAQAQNAKAEAAQSSALYASAGRDLERTSQAFQAQRAALDAKRDEQLNKQIAAVNEAGTLQIDPNHFWANSSTQQRITAGLGIMFSMAGGGHKAVDVIDAAIKDDLNLQRANLELKLKGLDVRNNLMSQMHEITGDINDAEKLAEAAQLNQVKFKIEQVKSSVGGAEANANALNAIGQLEERRAKLMSEVAKNAGPQADLAARYAGQSTDKYYGLSGPNDFPTSNDAAEKFVYGYGQAYTKEGAQKLREVTATLPAVDHNLGILIDAAKKGFMSDLPGPTREKVKTAATLLMGPLRESIILTTRINEREIEMLNQMAKDPTVIGRVPSWLVPSLEEVQNTSRSNVNNLLMTNGIKPKFQDPYVTESLPKAPGSK